MNITKEQISKRAEESYNEIIDIRRYLHAHPELSFNEVNTSRFICSILDSWNVSYRSGIAGNGIVAEIRGKNPGRVIGFRADMDALPIHELNEVSYKSINEGVMHACGHDVHSASLLGLVKLLNELKEEFNGVVKFVFQPAEERIPGGAKLMLEENLFGDEQPEIMIAQHVYPELEAGTIGIKEGQYMASSDEIYITVEGKGGHAALPHTLVDSVLISSHLIVALQQIASRNAPAAIPTVLSFGKVVADGAVNVIPDKVTIEGTFRTMDEEWRAKAHELIKLISKNIVEGMGGKAMVQIRKGYPVLFNNIKLTSTVRNYAIDYLGQEKVNELQIRMTAEDFAYFSQKYDSVLFRLGVAEKGTKGAALHTANFDVDEKAIITSVGLMTWLAMSLLSEE
jgi:amidohydrolase